MNIYRISQDVHSGYDTYDSAVVVAISPKRACRIHPRSVHEKAVVYLEEKEDFGGTWADYAKDVTFEFLGKARNGMKEQVICASFNAG